MVAVVLVLAAAVALSGPRSVANRVAKAGATPLPSPASAAREQPPPVDNAPTIELRLGPAPGKVVWAFTYPQQRLYRSLDGGVTWEPRSLPAGVPLLNPEITFVDDHEGWLFTGGSPATQCTEEDVGIWHTTDAATTWTSVGSSGISTAQCKQGIVFVDASHGFLSAYDPNHRPVIYRTVDGGRSWIASAPLPDPPGQSSRPGGFTLGSWKVAREGAELLVGVTGFGHSYVYRSRDGGANWSWATTVTSSTDIVRVTFLDESTWWAVGNYTVGEIITRDAGRTWEPVPSSPQTAAPVPPTVVFVDRSTGYATTRGGLARTDDGGQTWKGVSSPPDFTPPTQRRIDIGSGRFDGDASAPVILLKLGTDPAVRALSWDASKSGTTGAMANGYILPSADGRYYVAADGIFSRSGARLAPVPWTEKGLIFRWSANDELCHVTASPLATGSPLLLQVAAIGQSHTRSPRPSASMATMRPTPCSRATSKQASRW